MCREEGAQRLRALGVTDSDILRRAAVVTVAVEWATKTYTVPPTKRRKRAVNVSFQHLRASPGPPHLLRLSPELGDLIFFLRQGPTQLSTAQCEQLVGIAGASAEAALAALEQAEWSPLLVLDFGPAASRGELQRRWQSHGEALKAIMDSGVEGQPRGAATSSDVSDRLWCATPSSHLHPPALRV